MGSSYAFKISASIVKPSRESCLDYCCYLLIILSLIGIARVWIGGDSLHEECDYDELASNGNENLALGDVKYDDDTWYYSENEEETGSGAPVHQETAISNFTRLSTSNITTSRRRPCPKSYQAMFAYILLIESIVLLLVGLLWVKAPKINVTLKKFSKLVRSCRVCGWAKQALKVLTDSSHVDMSLSLQSVTSGQNAHDRMCSLLDRLFHPDSDYSAKANARHLYEKVQIFCLNNNHVTDLWTSYIIKSLVQFCLWIIVFNANIVLFVFFQFYVRCSEDPDVPCNHDIFLRIIWFMSEFMLVVYAVFNCKTLKWINEHSTVRQNLCCSTLRCVYDHTYLQESDDPLLTCRPYRYSTNNPVYNDTALILHLFEESHPKLLPYFVVFMFEEWKDKLTSFPQPTLQLELPGGPMRILSGRPPPVIEITDIPLRESVSSSHSPQCMYEISGTVQKEPSVKFFVGTEFSSEDEKDRSKNGNFDVYSTKCKSFSEKGSTGFKATDSSSYSRQSSSTSRDSASSTDSVAISKMNKLTPDNRGIGRFSPRIKLREGSPTCMEGNDKKPTLSEGKTRASLSRDDRFSQGDNTDEVKSKDTTALLSDASSCISEQVADENMFEQIGNMAAKSSETVALLK